MVKITLFLVLLVFAGNALSNWFAMNEQVSKHKKMIAMSQEETKRLAEIMRTNKQP